MAFYARRGHDNYHTAILVSPKKAKPDDTSTWELHVRNRPNPSRPTGEGSYCKTDRALARFGPAGKNEDERPNTVEKATCRGVDSRRYKLELYFVDD